MTGILPASGVGTLIDAMTVDVVIGTAVAALAAFEAWVAYAGESVHKPISH